MDVHAHLRYLRMSARKVRLVADLVRGMDIQHAEDQLQVSTKRAALPLLKLLLSAVANAENNFKMNREGLYIKSLIVNQGPALKRFRARAFGSGAAIKKHSAHISIVLSEKPGVKRTEKKTAAAKHPTDAESTKGHISQRTPKKLIPKSDASSTTEPRTKGKRIGDTIVPRQGKD